MDEIAPMARELVQMKSMVQQYMDQNEKLRGENIRLAANHQCLAQECEDIFR